MLAGKMAVESDFGNACFSDERVYTSGPDPIAVKQVMCSKQNLVAG